MRVLLSLIVLAWCQVSPAHAVEFIQGANIPVEARQHDVRIDTNGVLAAVRFDVGFVVAGKVTDRGSESRQMVRAEEGRKIGSMPYSRNN